MSNLILFEEKQVRRVWNENEQKWYFSVSDVCGILVDTPNFKGYWRILKHREPELVTICNGLKLKSADEKMRKENSAAHMLCASQG